LIDEVRENQDKTKVRELQSQEDAKAVSTFFKSGKTIKPILKDFSIFLKMHPSQFSRHFLKIALQNSATLSLVTFVDDIWKPVYSQCLEFVQSIEDKTIKLSEVHKVYSEYVGDNRGEKNQSQYLHSALRERDNHNVKNQLHSLYLAIEKSLNREPVSVCPKWIEDAVEHMFDYLSFCKQSTAAKIILDLKKKLRLNGNFELVDEVAKQMISSTQDHPLSSVDKSRVATAVSFFAEISSSDDKYISIQKFAECSDIVQWIQKETKGRWDLGV